MFSKILLGFCRQLPWRTVCALFSETVLAAALVLLAALPSSAGIGDGRHLVRNLSNNGANNSSPQISGTNVVWEGNADGNNDIYLHDGTGLTNLSNNGANNYNAQISGSSVVWEGNADGNNDIYLHDGTSLTNLSNNAANNESPRSPAQTLSGRAMPTGTTTSTCTTARA